MTILCPAEFADAVRFASQADDALEAAIFHCGNAEERRKLEAKRGQGVKTLLQCFGWRANADAQDNRNPAMLDSTLVRWPDGREAAFASLPAADRPVRDTFVFADWARHSFFFREEWLDPVTRQRVELYDDCWYVFRRLSPAEADAIPEDELPQRVGNDVERSFTEPYARAVQNKVMACGGTGYIRCVKQRRTGMCGGIIYHADYVDGKQAGFGSWSTHT